eukprot:3588411-Rhodomonas_salina.1
MQGDAAENGRVGRGWVLSCCPLLGSSGCGSLGLRLKGCWRGRCLRRSPSWAASLGWSVGRWSDWGCTAR